MDAVIAWQSLAALVRLVWLRLRLAWLDRTIAGERRQLVAARARFRWGAALYGYPLDAYTDAQLDAAIQAVGTLAALAPTPQEAIMVVYAALQMPAR